MKSNRYKILLEELGLRDGTESWKTLEFEVTNHDDIFKVLWMIQDASFLKDDADNTPFIIGLKLFSEVLLKNRNNPLFEELWPAFSEFMKKLKETAK